MGIDQREGGEFLAKFMEARGLKEHELPQAADYLQRAKFAGGLSKEQMYGSMSYNASTVRSLKLTGLENTKKLLALEGLAGQQGLEGTSFGTNFSTFLDRINEGPKMLAAAKKGMKAEAKAMMQAAKVDFQFFDKKGDFKGIDDTLKELMKFKKIQAKFGDEGISLVAKELFNVEGARVAKVLIEQGEEGLAKFLAKMEEQASLTQRIEQKIKTLGAALEGVEIICESFHTLLPRFQTQEKVLLLLDPPYLFTRQDSYKQANYFDLIDFLRLIDLTKPPYLFFSSTKSEFIRFIHYRVEAKKEGWQNFEGAERLVVKETTNYSNRYEDNLVYKF